MVPGTVQEERSTAILRCSSPPVSLAIRGCEKRGGNTLTDVDTIAALHRQLSLLRPLEWNVISTGAKSREATLGMLV